MIQQASKFESDLLSHTVCIHKRCQDTIFMVVSSFWQVHDVRMILHIFWEADEQDAYKEV